MLIAVFYLKQVARMFQMPQEIQVYMTIQLLQLNGLQAPGGALMMQHIKNMQLSTVDRRKRFVVGTET